VAQTETQFGESSNQLGDWGLVSGSLHSHVVEHFFHEEPVQELFIIDIEVLSVLQEVK